MKINTLDKGEQLKKYHVALLVNNGTDLAPSWVQIEKSTSNTITMNAETNDRDFIVDTSPTTILDRYKPSLSEPITLYKGNPDYEFFFGKFYNRATGSKANGQLLIVFMNEEETTGELDAEKTVYKAWLSDCVFVCTDLNPVDGILTFDINLNGTIDNGTVEIDEDGNPTFTATAA